MSFSTLIYSCLDTISVRMKKYIRKICLLGDGGVGKTSLIRRYVLDVFKDEYIQTFGTKVTKKVLDIGENRLTLMIWDILGQNSYPSLHEAYYRGSQGALLVSDLTREETVISLPRWRDSLYAVTGEIPVVPVANKSDLEWQVSDRTIREIEEKLGEPFTISSAKTGEGVNEAFKKIAEYILEGID